MNSDFILGVGALLIGAVFGSNLLTFALFTCGLSAAERLVLGAIALAVLAVLVRPAWAFWQLLKVSIE